MPFFCYSFWETHLDDLSARVLKAPFFRGGRIVFSISFFALFETAFYVHCFRPFCKSIQNPELPFPPIFQFFFLDGIHFARAPHSRVLDESLFFCSNIFSFAQKTKH